ncbi:hypothetical protein H5410_028174 [Solanum commersonii]|uniref:Uncharacterized protein n=1 Tax=Solanum commersonii TaxID=4109 RepID=A0A9J5Z1X3_SOLCO|nr:hypothetical protein H5410_028174 [Solanum commersonii]
MGLDIAFCSSVLSPEGKGQVGDEMDFAKVPYRPTTQNAKRMKAKRGRKTKTTKLIAGGISSTWVQLERVNPSPSPTHFRE